MPPLQYSVMDSRKPLLPLEVLERIVDEGVATSELLSVSKDLRDCVLRHLFRTVEIDNIDDRIEQLRDIINCPNQAAHSAGLRTASSYVKDLVLRFCHNQADRSLHGFFDQDTVMAILTTIQREGCLSSLTFKVAVNADDEKGKPHSWNDLSQRFRDVLKSLFQLPSLSSITIVGLDDVPQELIQGKIPGAQTHSSALPPIAPGPPAKQKAKADYAFRFTTINALQEIWNDVEKVGPSMKKLKLTEKYEDYASALAPSVSVPNIPAITIVPNLRKLAYVASSIDGRSPYLQILCGLLSVATPHKGLKRLILDLKYETFIASVQEAVNTVAYRREMWARVDQLLASGSFPALSAIRITVKIPVCAPGLAQAPGLATTVEAAVATLFAAAGQKTCISVKVNARSLKIRR